MSAYKIIDHEYDELYIPIIVIKGIIIANIFIRLFATFLIF